MSKIAINNTGIRYLDNLVSLNTLHDGICKSGFGRVFDGTQSIIFSDIAVNAAYYMTYFDYNQVKYIQQQYNSQTFSDTGTFSNFAIWDRQLLNNELDFLNNNIEFIYNNNYNQVTINGISSLHGGNCLAWVPMLPIEGASVYNYVNKSSYTISNYSVDTIISDSMYGPQLIDYSDTMTIDKYVIYIRDNEIETNWIPSSTESWTLEEIVDNIHIMYTYNYLTNEFMTYVNGEYIKTSTYTFTGTKIILDNSSFSVDITDISTRWYFVLYNKLFNSAELMNSYIYFLMADYSLTLDRGSTLLTANSIPLVYTPLTY